MKTNSPAPQSQEDEQRGYLSEDDKELDELVRRIHFSQASFDELTTEELYDDTPAECLTIINEGKAALLQNRKKAEREAEIRGLKYAVAPDGVANIPERVAARIAELEAQSGILKNAEEQS